MKAAVTSVSALCAMWLCGCGSPQPDAPPSMARSRLDDDAGFSCNPPPDAGNGADSPQSEASFDATSSDVPADPRALTGEWGPVSALPIVPVHIMMAAPSAKLLFFNDVSQTGQRFLYDPSNNSVTSVGGPSTNLFCAGHSALADGRLLILGGAGGIGFPGLTTTTLFTPATETWETYPSMAFARWYGNALTLGDGRVLAISGQQFGVTLTTPEVFNTQTNSWSTLSSATITTPLYPFMFQLPDGRVMMAGASEGPTNTQALNVATQQWTTIDPATIDAGSMRQYAVNRFIKAGSASDSGRTGSSSNTAYTLDLSAPNPVWQPTAPMSRPRSFLNLTSLPDGTVLVTGGGTDKSSYNENNCVKESELWEPGLGTWRTLSSMQTCRMYHSSATLLPDGRVMVAGQGGDTGVTDHPNFEMFSPPYLFKGPRPVITSAPATLNYWVTTLIETPNTDIAKVALIRTPATTHSFDQNGRTMFLSFTQAAGGVVIQTPMNSNAAPPGYYMLYLVNSAGVPSVAAFVRFPAAWETPMPDAGPDVGSEPVAEAGPPPVDAGLDTVDAGADVVDATADVVDAKADVADAGADADAGSSRVFIGESTQLTVADSNGAGSAEAFKYAATLTGAATKLSLYMTVAGRSVRLGIYSHSASGDRPQTLLASGSFTSVVGWNTITIPATNIASGTNYWIAFLGVGGNMQFVERSASAGLGSLTQGSGLTALPATWSTSGLQRWGSSGASAYAGE